MSNRPLHVGCPVCSGTGQVSWLRSGSRINTHCPGANGPVDVDSSPFTHELDNYHAKRKARVEYKRTCETITAGQRIHLKAELESLKQDWHGLVVVVLDEGQTTEADTIRYMSNFTQGNGRFRHIVWQDEWNSWTVGALGRNIAEYLWVEQLKATG